MPSPTNGQLMARKLMSGDEVWKRKYSGYRDMAVTGNAIVLTDSRSHLFAVDRRNGLELWSNTQLENWTVTAPVILGDYAWWSGMWRLSVLAGPHRRLHQGHAAARQQWSYAAPWWMVTPVCVQSRGGKLYAVKLSLTPVNLNIRLLVFGPGAFVVLRMRLYDS